MVLTGIYRVMKKLTFSCLGIISNFAPSWFDTSMFWRSLEYQLRPWFEISEVFGAFLQFLYRIMGFGSEIGIFGSF